MSDIEAFLDDTPGETRAAVAVDGRFTQLIHQSDDADPALRLGARAVGRVAEAAPGLHGAFFDLGGDLAGFLPGKGAAVGERLEVEVLSEPRDGKGPVLRRIGPAEGPPRLLAPGPSVHEWLHRIAPGLAPREGAEAIRAVSEAGDEAMGQGGVLSDLGLDVCVQRTRALVAVDLDLAPSASGSARRRANEAGLREAARLIGLKSWGGLVVIDLVGAGHDGAAVLAQARAAFAQPEVAFGPVSRFGLVQLSLPWRRAPIEQALDGADGRRRPLRRAIDGVRALRLALLEDRAAPRLILALPPQAARLAEPLVERLGPRAGLRSDADLAADAYRVVQP